MYDDEWTDVTLFFSDALQSQSSLEVLCLLRYSLMFTLTSTIRLRVKPARWHGTNGRLCALTCFCDLFQLSDGIAKS